MAALDRLPWSSREFRRENSVTINPASVESLLNRFSSLTCVVERAFFFSLLLSDSVMLSS